MAHKPKQLLQLAIQTAEAQKPVSISELVKLLPCSRTAFYDLELAKNARILQILQSNKIEKKANLVKTEIWNAEIKTRVSSLDRISKDYSTQKTTWHSSKYIYVVNCKNTNLYKIGVSKIKPNYCLAQLQTGCPYKLDLLYIFECSKPELIKPEIHRFLSRFNLRSEWFELNDLDEVLKIIKEKIENQNTELL